MQHDIHMCTIRWPAVVLVRGSSNAPAAHSWNIAMRAWVLTISAPFTPKALAAGLGAQPVAVKQGGRTLEHTEDVALSPVRGAVVLVVLRQLLHHDQLGSCDSDGRCRQRQQRDRHALRVVTFGGFPERHEDIDFHDVLVMDEAKRAALAGHSGDPVGVVVVGAEEVEQRGDGCRLQIDEEVDIVGRTRFPVRSACPGAARHVVEPRALKAVRRRKPPTAE